MATQLAVPNETPYFAGEVLPPESTPIAEFHLELQNAARNLRRSLARIAYFGWKMRLNEGWTALQFEPGPRGEDAYRESLGIPRSTYYKYVRIGQSLHQLTLADLEQIPVTNAELLIQVDPSIQHDHSWVAEAKSMPPAKFATLVADRNKTVGGSEPLSTMVFHVAFLAKQAMENMLEAIQKKHELSSKGQALELMIADLQHDANLLAAVDQARRLLDGVMKSQKARQAPETEESQWLAMAKEVLDAGYEEAVEAARQKSYRGQKNGGRA
jgi:hypothetical protein